MNQNVSEQELAKIDPFLKSLPLISLPLPQIWEFEPLEIVTAQFVAGTGLFAEVVSEVTDLFGARSGIYAKKIRYAEDECKRILRLEALRAGGHGVLGIDVDYAEVGGAKAMLMVAMTGTAVRFTDLEKVVGHGAENVRKAAEIMSDIINPPCGWCGRKLDERFRTCTSFDPDDLRRLKSKVVDPLCVGQIRQRLG